jgi:hypothetical protein
VIFVHCNYAAIKLILPRIDPTTLILLAFSDYLALVLKCIQ